MPAWLWEAYEWCEELVLKADPPTILPHLRLSDGSTLPDHLPPQLWRQLSALWPTVSPQGPLAPLKPWAAMIGIPGILLSLAPGVETHLIERTKAEPQTIHFLETSDDAARLLDGVPSSVYADYLALVVSNPDLVRDGIHALHVAWLRRDLDGLLAVASETPLWGSPILHEAVIYARNRMWIPHIRSFAQSERRTLVVVGALHLCGKGNVAELYQQQERHTFSLIDSPTPPNSRG